jgi:hypothetical protein
VLVLTIVSAAFGVFGCNPYQVDNLTQITLASNLGTFIVYGATCGIALVAFASRHDRHLVKHIAIPGLGLVLNVFEMLGVLYIAVTGSGTTPGDAYKAIGVIWVVANPHKRHAQTIVRERARRSLAAS